MAISDLSERQQKLFQAIVKEYIEEAKPIGSENLVRKYGLDISPATVRNEMVRLVDEGLLEKPHASSGRIPTTTGFRYFINELLEEEDLPVIEEVSIKQRLWPQRFDSTKLFQEAALALGDSTQSLSLILAADSLFHAGAVNILEHPEFFDIDVTRTVLHLLDRKDLVAEIFARAVSDQGVNTLIGSELGLSNLTPCGLVFTHFETKEGRGTVAVLGPNRMNYAKMFPRVRYMADLLEELSKEW